MVGICCLYNQTSQPWFGNVSYRRLWALEKCGIVVFVKDLFTKWEIERRGERICRITGGVNEEGKKIRGQAERLDILINVGRKERPQGPDGRGVEWVHERVLAGIEWTDWVGDEWPNRWPVIEVDRWVGAYADVHRNGWRLWWWVDESIDEWMAGWVDAWLKGWTVGNMAEWESGRVGKRWRMVDGEGKWVDIDQNMTDLPWSGRRKATQTLTTT